MTERSVFDELARILPTIPPAERRVARELLAEYPFAAHQSIGDLAQAAAVSAPTVLRLARRLGYSGYPELRQAVWRDMAGRTASPLLLSPQAAPGVDEHVLARADALFAGAPARLSATVDAEQFDGVIGLLADPKRRIYIAGGRSSRHTVSAFALDLQAVRPSVHLLAEDHEQVRFLLDLKHGDVLILSDLRRYQRSVISFGERAAELGATVVVITDPWMSPLVACAAKMLVIPVQTLGPFDSLVPLQSLVEALTAALFERSGSATEERMRRSDALWDEYGVPLSGPGEEPRETPGPVGEDTPEPAKKRRAKRKEQG
ncbi:MurR/RpiR family transcriptional regulator [Streptomyces sp. SHP 1-2]|uniref:MurR/RpiR family transcriptional regulator n=1 Tax=Streptomyces sp. SHP 1-2 TaxID=2769489 RepID=UPI0022373D7A|nr:MurR/RpiR family transcriptional regulator [Streptomyces sp. SHP 1-2]